MRGPAARRPPETAAKIIVSGSIPAFAAVFFPVTGKCTGTCGRQRTGTVSRPEYRIGAGKRTGTHASIVKQAGKRIGGRQDGALGIQDYTGADQDSRRHRGTGKEAGRTTAKTAHSEYRTAPEGRAGLAPAP